MDVTQCLEESMKLSAYQLKLRMKVKDEMKNEVNNTIFLHILKVSNMSGR